MLLRAEYPRARGWRMWYRTACGITEATPEFLRMLRVGASDLSSANHFMSSRPQPSHA